MVIMYPLANQLDYTELKYSLRSIDKYFPKPFEVVIVGSYLPAWINNVTHIHLPDVEGRPNYSVRRKVMAALAYAKEFFFFNDDIFLLDKIDPKNFPYYTSGVLTGRAESGARALLEQLQKLDRPVRYYGHYPAMYKSDFSKILEYFPKECITKSAYCNFTTVKNVEIPDCKLLMPKKPDEIKAFIKGKPCFSTGVHSLKSALPVLKELFPDECSFEI